MSSKTFVFGQVKPRYSQVFFSSRFTRGVVNLKPVVPGHVLVVPKRRTSRFAELSADEVTDLWLSAQKIAVVIEKEFNGTAVTFALQDGKAAGQTIDHVHVHIIPRSASDFAGDDVYKKLEEDRKPRTEQEMTEEASFLRSKFGFSEFEEEEPLA